MVSTWEVTRLHFSKQRLKKLELLRIRVIDIPTVILTTISRVGIGSTAMSEPFHASVSYVLFLLCPAPDREKRNFQNNGSLGSV
ncbi:hypothetical protein ACRRTK_002639 [Alexandromys fortis]